MKELLANYYNITINREVIVNGRVGYQNNEYIYFTIRATNNKAEIMEQAVLAYHLVEKGYSQTAIPVPNKNGEWITKYLDNNYVLIRVMNERKEIDYSHGKSLANFHRINSSYQYEPQNISSYGQWKPLWIKKLMVFENKIVEIAKEASNNYYRLLMDVLPYLIGISENAIQYIQESEHEQRHDESDQGTITFRRYDNNLVQPIIWSDDLMFDHLTRDLAEFVRGELLRSQTGGLEDIWLFFESYESEKPLSVFSWRLLYARLLFPIHFFDLIGKGFVTTDFDRLFNELTMLLEKQSSYEKGIKELFETAELNFKKFHIPMVHWL